MAVEKAFDELKAEHQKQVDLQQSGVDTLGKDKAALEERSNKLQERNKNLAKEKKGNYIPLEPIVADASLFCFALILIIAFYSHRTQKLVSKNR